MNVKTLKFSILWFQIWVNFHPREVVGHGSKTQFQVDEY